ncbi:DUF2784 domain-containing protein [Fodinibius halophilus]|uniref:DUF2784 domain-containing protein n=1 Tax=Fodinibius halophilus TaxID=1736908 RepID=A0A6M1T107_9BACT|nr:DUF2784 domain-containing protein [Fodinibius halophilus]NGP87637.1 DUF2784 domain-containing protein [Fodinibius halophilus]
MYTLLDVGFIIFHTLFILFNLFGWIWKKTRRWNLATLLLTAFSWFGLGIWYGFGYCPCTHWHWQVRQKLGYTDMPNSYIKFLIDELLGIKVSANVVDMWTGILFVAVLVVSVYVNWKVGEG